jgi:hypothetical protein
MDELEATVDNVLELSRKLHPDLEFDRVRLVREVETLIWVVQHDSVSMDDSTGHEEWMDLATNEINWVWLP